MEAFDASTDQLEAGGMQHDDPQQIAEDVRMLERLGYAQELLRRMSGFSNFAISLSIYLAN